MNLYKLVTSVPIVSVAVGISVFSHMPSPPKPDMGFELQDKVLHIVAYAIFGCCFYLNLYARRPAMQPLRSALLVVLVSAVFGLYDEIHQSFVPNRDASVADWLADCIGGGVALFFMKPLRRLAHYLEGFLVSGRNPSPDARDTRESGT